MIDAMVFAAGLGTRLRPLTDSIPKALVEVGGMSVLERAIRNILELDPGRIVVNAHHHADQIEAAVARLNRLADREFAGRPGVEPAGDGPGASGPREPRIRVSHERERPLETGGGLRHAAILFEGRNPVLLHNADVVTDLELGLLVAAHAAAPDPSAGGRALATLAVHDRESSRKLLFDAGGLYGRVDLRSGQVDRAREPRGASRALAFAGIHVVSHRLIETLPSTETFSITDHYLDLAREGLRIAPFDMGSVDWWEIGSPDRLEAARAILGPRG